MASGIFEQVKDLSPKVSVGMNGVKFLAFGTEGHHVLFTQDLNGCSGVVIVSKTAAILAHIAPRPNLNTGDPHAGLKHVRDRMREVMTLYQTYKGYFTPESDTLVISAMNEGQISLPRHKELIEKLLEHFELTHATVTYLVVPSGESRQSSKGTIVVDGRGPIPQVYVEDRLIIPNRAIRVSENIGETTQSTSTQVMERSQLTPSRHSTSQAIETSQSTSRPISSSASRHQPSQYMEDSMQHTSTQTHGGHAEELASTSRQSPSQSQGGTQTIPSSSQKSQQNVLQRVRDGLLGAGDHEEFLRMANDLKIRFKGQPGDFQRQFLEVVRHVRDVRATTTRR